MNALKIFIQYVPPQQEGRAMASEWTKGPWVIDYSSGDYAAIIDHRELTSDQRDIAYINGEVADADGFADAAVARANAHLIAAAPMLAEIIEGICDFYDSGGEVDDWFIDKAKAALAKARGEATEPRE